MTPNYLDTLRQLSSASSASKVAERGSLRVQLGFVEEGLNDLKEAASLPASSYWVEAQLAEAHRVYVRDVMLSAQERLKAVYVYLQQECIARFQHALSLARAAGAPPKTLAWIHAHTGAAQTLLYFVMSNSGPLKKERMSLRFDQAVASFEAARALEPDYAWCTHLEAYLMTLRGAPGDFQKARELLTQAKDLGGMSTAALNRNLAMLHSFEAAALGEQSEQATAEQSSAEPLKLGIQAANDSIQRGLEVMREDPDDPFAAYTVAASLGWLHLKAGQADCKEHLAAAVAAATTRAKNTLSRTYATLAGLALLENEFANPERSSSTNVPPTHHEQTAQDIFRRFVAGELSIDIETWAMFNRDPIWRSHPYYRDLLKVLSEGLDSAAQAAE
jgi:tetratricopeptide (TPR) repeat protein